MSFLFKFFSYHTIVDCINVFKPYPMFESNHRNKMCKLSLEISLCLKKHLEKRKDQREFKPIRPHKKTTRIIKQKKGVKSAPSKPTLIVSIILLNYININVSNCGYQCIQLYVLVYQIVYIKKYIYVLTMHIMCINIRTIKQRRERLRGQ